MFKSKPVNIVKQFICYILGLLIISVGINFSKMSALGITPVSSIPRACEQIWGLTLGNTTMIIYILLVVLQLVILRRQFKLINALGILVTFVISAIGVFIYLRPKWVPMPAEGFAGALATVTGKPFGDCKTAADTTMVIVALILQIIFLGGLSSFLQPGVVVREGTIFAAIGIGQIVKLITKKFGKPLEDWLHKGDELVEKEA